MKHIKKYSKLILVILIMLVVTILCYQPFTNLLKNPAILKQQLDNYGFIGKIILALAMALQVVFVFLPGEIIEVASGFCYGYLEGAIICLLGSLIGTIIIYFLVHKFGHKVLNNKQISDVTFLQNHQHLEIIIFLLFFIPGTPKDLITYIAPFTKIKQSTFIIITSIARIPSIFTSTISGSALFKQNYQLSIIIFVVTGAVSLIGLFFYHRFSKQKNL